MALDDFQALNARQLASEMVLKATLHMLHQMAPQGGLAAALHQVMDISVPAINVNDATPEQAAEFRSYIHNHAKTIIDGGAK